VHGDDKPDDPGKPEYWLHGMDEAAAPFVHDPAPSLQTLTDFYGAVVRAYGYRCAMTGLAGEPALGVMRDGLEVVAIRPLAHGGALHVSNFLCLSDAARTAFERGHIAIGPKLELLVDLSRIDSELLERLHRPGRLRPPEGAQAQPDQRALAYHRSKMFLGQPGAPR
jgi:predicted restriction endonuclease